MLYTYLCHPKNNSWLGHEPHAADFLTSQLDAFHDAGSA